MSGILLQAVEKKFPGDKTVLFPLSLEIKEGEFLVLVGPSGCGKTTTLRLIAGLEEVSGGTIHIQGRDVTWLEPKKRGVAMVFQNYALYPHMTVLENLLYPLNILKLGKQEKSERVKSVASMLEIDGLLHSRPAQLSGGQQQRVAIGRALVREPEVFLFDEPLSNLDARLREQMRVEIAALHRKLRRTSVYVTHDQTEAMTLGERIAVMNEGKLVQVGTPLDLFHQPDNLFVAQFLGTPPINVLNGEFIGEDLFKGSFGQVLINDPPKAEEKQLILALRPEYITLLPSPDMGELSGTIELVEYFGKETHYHIPVGEQKILVSSRDFIAKEGEKVGIKLDQANLLWFSSSTHQRVPTRIHPS